MKKNYTVAGTLLCFSVLILALYFTQNPWITSPKSPNAFDTQKALVQVKKMTQNPHYVGSAHHEQIANYLIIELKKLGLQPQYQVGTTLSDWGNLVPSKNIIARIPGIANAEKALLLLAHYDSAPHSYSYGASDDASGVATILEGVRAFLHSKTQHKNDIIILFTDAEELGLNGAALFVTQHAWAKEVGLALNFEARGTSGPSYMLMEVNQGNSQMIQAFSQANPQFPVTNSLLYSIYKMLPNDTDLTVFREQGTIQGFNFAFIDNHFNYHTAQDDFAHLNPKTIAHQGSYLMPLLRYFSNSDLTALESAEDEVYFTLPFVLVHYPFSWNYVLCGLALGLFILLVFIGLGKRVLDFPEIGKGFLRFFGLLLLAGGGSYLLWLTLKSIYPFADILQGFPYNGHWYIGVIILFVIGLAFLIYANATNVKSIYNYFIAPLCVWLVLQFFIVAYLPGAGFFVLPLFGSLFLLGYFVATQKSNHTWNLLCSVPAILIYSPFIVVFPIGLGLKMLPVTALFTAFVFGLVLPVFLAFERKALWGIGAITVMGISLFMAHSDSSYEAGKAKPNSLLYVYDAETKKAVYTTYDTQPDEWTKTYLGNNPSKANAVNALPLFSKYQSKFTFEKPAPRISLNPPTVVFEKDSMGANYRYIQLSISPNRKVNRYDVFAPLNMNFYNLKANGASTTGQKGSKYLRQGKKILSYYVVDNQPLVLSFQLPKSTVFDMELLESSFDLLTHPQLKIKPRAAWMMPTPFVLNDAVVLRQKIKHNALLLPKKVKFAGSTSKIDSSQVAVDTLKTDRK